MDISRGSLNKLHKYEAYVTKPARGERNSNKPDKKETVFKIEKDILILTDEAKKQMENDREFFIQKKEAEELLKNSKKETEGIKKSLKYQLAMFKIFRRIAKGDKVPPKDEKALIEYDEGLYMAAKNLAQLAKNKKLKKHKSIIEALEKEEKERAAKEAQSNSKTQTDAEINKVSEVEGADLSETSEESGSCL